MLLYPLLLLTSSTGRMGDYVRLRENYRYLMTMDSCFVVVANDDEEDRFLAWLLQTTLTGIVSVMPPEHGWNHRELIRWGKNWCPASKAWERLKDVNKAINLENYSWMHNKMKQFREFCTFARFTWWCAGVWVVAVKTTIMRFRA